MGRNIRGVTKTKISAVVVVPEALTPNKSIDIHAATINLIGVLPGSRIAVYTEPEAVTLYEHNEGSVFVFPINNSDLYSVSIRKYGYFPLALNNIDYPIRNERDFEEPVMLNIYIQQVRDVVIELPDNA